MITVYSTFRCLREGIEFIKVEELGSRDKDCYYWPLKDEYIHHDYVFKEDDYDGALQAACLDLSNEIKKQKARLARLEQLQKSLTE
jgi:hypothetical protein